MNIEQYGIRLRRVEKQDIELIRYWRNHPRIQQYMDYRKTISKKQQEKWFYSIDNVFNFYCIIEYNKKEIGIINIKNINYDEMSGEGGIFVWEEKLENEYIPTFASLCMLNFSFLLVNCRKSYIKVLKDNYKSISYNKKLGYQQIAEDSDFIRFELTKERYLVETKKLNEIALKLTQSTPIPIIKGKYDNRLFPEYMSPLFR